MVRPKLGDKRTAILEKAATLFGERGLVSTPTSAISNAAGIAEGTLFTYFKTKDELINELYLYLKGELAQAMLSGFPAKGSVKLRLRYAWDHYVGWGAANPLRSKAIAQLLSSGKLTPQSRRLGLAPFAVIYKALETGIKQGELSPYPLDFIAAMFGAQAEATMAFMPRGKKAGHDYCASGFEMFWSGIAAKGVK